MTSMGDIQFSCKPFQELSIDELYACLQLRQEVFVVEQNCPYLDADGKDQQGWHLMGWQGHTLVAYTRLLPQGVSYPEYVSIGRVLTRQTARRSGLGKALMQASLQHIHRLFPGQPIKISAQCYLIAFYESFGFQCKGTSYLEDDIPHIAMIKS